MYLCIARIRIRIRIPNHACCTFVFSLADCLDWLYLWLWKPGLRKLIEDNYGLDFGLVAPSMDEKDFSSIYYAQIIHLYSSKVSQRLGTFIVIFQSFSGILGEQVAHRMFIILSLLISVLALCSQIMTYWARNGLRLDYSSHKPGQRAECYVGLQRSPF